LVSSGGLAEGSEFAAPGLRHIWGQHLLDCRLWQDHEQPPLLKIRHSMCCTPDLRLLWAQNTLVARLAALC